MQLMVRMTRENNLTLVLVTHDRDISRYADRIVELVDGRILSDTYVGKRSGSEIKRFSEELHENLENSDVLEPDELYGDLSPCACYQNVPTIYLSDENEDNTESGGSFQ